MVSLQYRRLGVKNDLVRLLLFCFRPSFLGALKALVLYRL